MTHIHRQRVGASVLTAAVLGSVAVAPASATPQPVNGAQIGWTQTNVYSAAPVRTFLGHVTNPGNPARGQSNGTAGVSGGASLLDATGAPVTHIGPTSPRGVDATYTALFPSTGTYDPETGQLELQGAGTLSYAAYPGLGAPIGPVPVLTVVAPRVSWNTKTGTGAVYASGDGAPGGGTAVPYDAATPLFSLSAAASGGTPATSGTTPSANMVVTLAKAGVFGSAAQYPPGTAGPDRTPNTFGGFGVSYSLGQEQATITPPLAAPPTPTPTPVAAAQPRTETLTIKLAKQPFKAKRAIQIKLRRRGEWTILGDGSVKGRTLTVTVRTGTALSGGFVLRRQSPSAVLPKSKVVTLG
ncbi:MAG: hypothetical protein JHD16_10310 [Solirubrobacteraceae bacterium]|nr:hypothetical protein [Solirubrobacteraceae bacterium]